MKQSSESTCLSAASSCLASWPRLGLLPGTLGIRSKFHLQLSFWSSFSDLGSDVLDRSSHAEEKAFEKATSLAQYARSHLPSIAILRISKLPHSLEALNSFVRETKIFRHARSSLLPDRSNRPVITLQGLSLMRSAGGTSIVIK